MNKYKAFDFIEFESKFIDGNLDHLNSLDDLNSLDFLNSLDAIDSLDDGRLNFNKNHNNIDDDTKLLMEESAAIMEFDQGLSRDESEYLSLQYIMQKD